MATVTVNISFREDLLEDIDAEAKREARSRSELLREAARMYVSRQRRWNDVFALGDQATHAQGLAEIDVAEEIRVMRSERSSG